MSAPTFVWDRDYGNREQVRPYLADYSALRNAGLSYNDDFLGRIEGISGTDDEKTAIYMLSCLWRIEPERAEIDAAERDGYVRLTDGKPNTRKHYDHVIVYRAEHYVGGTGMISRYESARIAFGDDSMPTHLLPKGKRTNGYDVRSAHVYVKSAR